MVIIFAANKPSKKLLSNLHMCWESATCNRFRKHPFRWSGDGDLKTSGLYVRAFSGCTDRFLCTFFSKACRYSVAASPRLWVARALVSFSSHRAPPCSRLFDLRHRPEDYSMSWSFTAIQVFPVCWLSPCAAKHSVMGYVLSQSQQWTSLSCETQEICLWPSGHCLGCSNRKMDVTFPNSRSRMRKPIISPLAIRIEVK